MIIGIWHPGSGLGNQLARYVFTRIKALDLGVPFGMLGEFKGDSFMKIDKGGIVPRYIDEGVVHNFLEERINNDQGVDIRPYDVKTESIVDNTVVDGEFQDEKYWKHREDEVREWLKVEPLDMPEDLCVIGFRGGEYVGVKDLFLTKDYWDLAIAEIKQINPNMKFEVHTDDPTTAQQFFPDYECIHDIGLNWRSVRYAKYLIIANSSFFIFPALLGEAKVIYAPMFWAGRNVGYWKLPQNRYSKFTYL